jgi:hypothetical protein
VLRACGRTQRQVWEDWYAAYPLRLLPSLLSRADGTLLGCCDIPACVPLHRYTGAFFDAYVPAMRIFFYLAFSIIPAYRKYLKARWRLNSWFI